MKQGLAIFFLLVLSTAFGQESDSSKFKVEDILDFMLKSNQDTAYIENLNEEISVRLLSVAKYNYFTLSGSSSSRNISYRPDNRANFGLGITYKIFSIDLAFNVGLSQNRTAEDLFQNTQYFDFTGSIFTSRHYAEVSYRYYFGHYLFSENQVPVNSESRARDDIRASFVGLEYLTAINFRKFSFKAPFVNNEIQRKSAGSVILGATFGTSSVDADSAMIPPEAKSDFGAQANLESFYLYSILLNGGYMYSFVKKGFYVTLSLIPGIAVVAGDFSMGQRTPAPLRLSGKFKTMNAVGYSARRWYGGIQITADIFGTRLAEGLGVQIVRAKGKIFVGYRFRRKKDR